MSFSFEFIAQTAEDAAKIVDEEHAPECVKAFIKQALTAYSGPVKVKANGHLYDGLQSYNVSTAQLEVTGVVFRQPKP